MAAPRPTLPQRLKALWQSALRVRADMVSALHHPTAWLSSYGWYGPTHAGIDVSPASAMTLPAYFAALRAISEDVGKLPLNTYQRLEPRGKRRAVDHPYYTLLHDAPNNLMGAMTWRESMTHYALAWGNAYAEIIRQAGEIVALGRPIHPSRVVPKFDEQGDLVYDIHIGDLSIPSLRTDLVTTLRLPQADVLHIRGLGDGLLGYSIAALAAESLGLSLAAQQYGASFFGHGTHTGGIFTHPNTLSDTAISHLRDSLDKYRVGGENAMKTMILEEGMKYERGSIPPDDAQFLECTTPDTLFTLADGTRCRADHLTKGMHVLSWDTAHGVLTTGVVHAVGSKAATPLLRITTDRGRVLTTTVDHPYWTARRQRTRGGRYRAETLSECASWMVAGSLQVGDYVRTALAPPIVGTKELDFQTGWLLGALVGDGYIRAGSIGFTSNTDAVTACMRQALVPYGATLQAATAKDYFIRTGGKGRRSSPFRRLMQETGLVGTHSHTKFVPECVIRSGHDAWAGFLSGYLDTDGAVWSPQKKQPAVWWASTSKKLLQDCQHLLTLLGIQSSLYGGESGYAYHAGFPNGKPLWNLYVTSHSQMQRLAEVLRPSHPEKSQRVQAVWPPVKTANPDFSLFDRIVSLEEVAPGPTIGVEISRFHSHVTEGLVTHNTRQFQVTEVARWFRIPPHKIGYLENATFSNIEHQAQEYVVDTLQPWLVRWEQELKRKLFPDEPTYFAEHQVLGLLRGDQQARSNYYRTLFYIGAMSPNDIRELENANPIVDEDGDPEPAGNLYYIQNNLATLTAVANRPAAPLPVTPAPADTPDIQEPEDEEAAAVELPPVYRNGHSHEENG